MAVHPRWSNYTFIMSSFVRLDQPVMVTTEGVEERSTVQQAL